MKSRCYNSNDSDYSDYGGRGITICPEWLGEHGFENFTKWSMENGYVKNLSIDRINVNGNYEPSNCRWATNEEQARNKRNTVKIVLNGEEKDLKQISDEYGVNYRTLHARIKKGVPIEKALKKVNYKEKVAKISLKTGEIIQIYESARKAAKENGFSTPNGILRCCIGKGFSCGGFGWEYVKGDTKNIGERYKKNTRSYFTRIDSGGRIVVPKKIRNMAEIETGTPFEIIVNNGKVLIRQCEFMCDNENSEGYGLSTAYDDCCEEFEEREES